MIALPQIQVFIVDGYEFAVQVPDNSVGCSGSRCTNCNGPVAFCDYHCQHCFKEFIGPFGFPQLLNWRSMTAQEQIETVARVHQNPGKGQLHMMQTSFFSPEEWAAQEQ